MRNPFRKRLIRPGMSFDPAKVFRPGDMWISSTDLVHAAVCFEPTRLSSQVIGSSLVVLSHVINSVVLSDRLLFIDARREEKTNPLARVLVDIQKHCDYLAIDDRHAVIQAVDFQDVEQYRRIIGPELTDILVSSYSQWTPRNPGNASTGMLADYSFALRSGTIYRPNPMIGPKLIQLLARGTLDQNHISGNDASSILLRVVEDLRREVALDYNTLRQAAIYELSLPAIFGAVLKHSMGSGDLIKVASQVSEEAKEFRKWCRELTLAEDPLIFLQGINDAQEALRKLGKTIDSRREVRAQLSVVPTILTAQMPFTISSSAERATRELEIDFSISGQWRFCRI